MTETTKASELAPCPTPWCKSHKQKTNLVVIRWDDYGCYGFCDGCGVHGPARHSKSLAITAWNDRAPLPNEGELVEIVTEATFDGTMTYKPVA